MKQDKKRIKKIIKELFKTGKIKLKLTNIEGILKIDKKEKNK